MKTKIFLIALAAITLLSFTLISTSHTTKKEAVAKKEAKSTQGGLAMQDSNQF